MTAERFKLSARQVEKSWAIVHKGPLTESGCDEVVAIFTMKKIAVEMLKLRVPEARYRREYRIERVRVCDVTRR